MKGEQTAKLIEKETVSDSGDLPDCVVHMRTE